MTLGTIDNKYQKIRLLGEGGFGQVWLAEDVLLTGRQVAIKTLKKADVGDASPLIEEMQHVSSLDHPHVVKFLHHFQDAENLHLVMEYCSSGSLHKYLQGKSAEPSQVFGWGKILTETFATIHRLGIVHHDIKPENLLLTKDNRLKIADFGVANRNIGTRLYMAPEYFVGHAVSSDDARVDVYALGLTLLELLLGKNPLRAVPNKDLVQTKVEHGFIPTHFDRWVQELLLKATHPTPERRFQTMMDFYEAIESRHVPFIIDGNRMKAQALAEKAERLLLCKKWRTSERRCNAALHFAPDCVAALVVAGRVNLMLRRTENAREYFSRALKINPRAKVQKELGWIALEEGNYPQAISMLADHLQREATDFEAANLLLQCFYLTDRYEAGLELAQLLRKEARAIECFANNNFLFQLLDDGYSQADLARLNFKKPKNPFLALNLAVATEDPLCWNKTKPSLKSKLLFQDYRFGSIEKFRTSPKIALRFEDENRQSLSTPIITIGRLSTNTVRLDESGISRRHAIIVNYPDDVWIYDQGSALGIVMDGVPVRGRAFLDGLHVIEIGRHKLEVRTKDSLLI